MKTNLIHVHYQHKPLAVLRSHAREKLKRRVDVDNLDALKAYNGRGSHLVKYFFMDEDQYRRTFDISAAVQLPGFIEGLNELGLEPPFQTW